MHNLDGGTDGDEFFEGLMDTKLMDGLIVFALTNFLKVINWERQCRFDIWTNRNDIIFSIDIQ